MVEKQWYEALFEDYGRKYDNESFVQGTMGECDFIEKELNFDKALQIIDIGCGTGRHSIELTKRGYSVTGIDLSESLLERAREKAKQEDLQIEFLRHDARSLPFENQFDAAIMLCEGGFPLMETDEMNFAILENVSQSLKGNATYDSKNFDLMTFRDYNITKVVDEKGIEKELECNERYYVPPEITWLLKTVGFTKIEIFGARLGAFSREDLLTTEDFEMLVIAGR